MHDERVWDTIVGAQQPAGPSLPFRAERESTPPPSPTPAPQPGGEACELLWSSPRAQAWARARAPEGPWRTSSIPPDDEERIERRQLALRLAQATPTPPFALASCYQAALETEGEPPIVVLRGLFGLLFDPLEELRCWVALLTPFKREPRVQEALELGQSVLDQPACAAEVISWARHQLEEAHKSLARRSQSAPREWVERTLLDRGAYRSCRVFGGPHLVAVLFDDAGRVALRCYVDEAIRDELPLLAKFPARLLVAVRAAPEPADQRTLSAQVLGLSRIMV